MTDWRYKIYARHVNDPVTYEIDLTVHVDQEKQLEGLRAEFGPTWDIWIDRFPREHPHAALQRRLNSREIHNRYVLGRPKNLPLGVIVDDDDNPLYGVRPRVTKLVAIPISSPSESPAAPAATSETSAQ